MCKLIWAVRLQQRARPQLDYSPSPKQTTNEQIMRSYITYFSPYILRLVIKVVPLGQFIWLSTLLFCGQMFSIIYQRLILYVKWPFAENIILVLVLVYGIVHENRWIVQSWKSKKEWYQYVPYKPLKHSRSRTTKFKHIMCVFFAHKLWKNFACKKNLKETCWFISWLCHIVRDYWHIILTHKNVVHMLCHIVRDYCHMILMHKNVVSHRLIQWYATFTQYKVFVRVLRT